LTQKKNRPAEDQKPVFGVLIVNTGTPDAPTPQAVRRFLAQFLADARVIEFPRWLWLPLLHGIILNVRPRRSARLYQRIWDEDGSPLLYFTQRLATGLETALQARLPASEMHVAAGMRYGNPSLVEGLRKLREQGVTQLLVLPLFPQYSATTTGTILDAVFSELQTWRRIPHLQTLSHYHDHPAYIHALAEQIRLYWESSDLPERLIFSFHGIPEDYVRAGDPYETQCHRTAALLATQLNLTEAQWQITFQSRFGPQTWLQPYTDETLEALGQQSLASLGVVCPGFAVDCLETIHEIGHEGREIYQNAGGGQFDYVPALNDTPAHVQALADVILSAQRNWLT